MKLFQIEYLLAVCEQGSISKAADAILVSRPAVSRAIKDLEEEFGVKLFQRASDGVALTEAGKVFYEKCVKLRQLIKELRHDMEVLRRETGSDADRQLTIGLSYTARCCTLPFLAAFQKAHPDVRLTMRDTRSSFLDTGVMDQGLDVEITLCAREKLEGVDCLPIGRSYFAFCCSRTHPLAGRESLSVHEIAQEPLVSLSGLDRKNNHGVSVFTENGIRPNVVYFTAQVSSLRQMVKEGLAGSVQPVQSMENDPDIATVRVQEGRDVRFALVWSGNVRHNSAFDDLLAYAGRYFQNPEAVLGVNETLHP